MKNKSLDEARERLAIAGSTGWGNYPDMEWVRTNLASAQVSATIAVAEALERLVTQGFDTTMWSRGYAAGWRHPSKNAAEEVAELTPTQTEEPF